jgi:hypothetical protein
MFASTQPRSCCSTKIACLSASRCVIVHPLTDHCWPRKADRWLVQLETLQRGIVLLCTTRKQLIIWFASCRCTCKRSVPVGALPSRREALAAVAVLSAALPWKAQAVSVTQDPKFIEETNKLSEAIRLYMALVNSHLLCSKQALEPFCCCT